LPGVLDDLERFVDHLTRFESESRGERIAEIIQAIQILSHSPLIGRPVMEPAPEAKVFWFFSSEKNKTLLFLKKKKQKDFYFSASRSKILDLA